MIILQVKIRTKKQDQTKGFFLFVCLLVDSRLSNISAFQLLSPLLMTGLQNITYFFVYLLSSVKDACKNQQSCRKEYFGALYDC